jgi:hypothetical protein
MLNALFDWLKRKLGHWLLKDEEAQEQARDKERARKQREIIDANYTVDDTERDLRSGDF